MTTNENFKQTTFYNVTDLQRLLRIGRNSAYKLTASKNFPSIYVGNRIIIPADRFGKWIDEQISSKDGEANG
jgi:hypothetical protein